MTTPASLPGVFRPAALPARIVALVLALALLAPTLAPAAGYDLLAWTPSHGHASLGVVAEHSHAWDADAPEGHSHEAAPGEGRAGVVFTPDDATGGAALPVMLAGALVPARALAVLVAASTGRGQAQVSVTPDSPPPR